MLLDDVLYTLSMVVLLGLLDIEWVCSYLLLQQNSVASVASGLQRGLDEVGEAAVNDRQLKLNVTKVAWAFVVLVAAGIASHTRFDDSHLGVHQTLVECVSVVLVGVSSLDFDCTEASNLIGGHQAELDGRYALRNLGTVHFLHVITSGPPTRVS